MIYTIEAAVHYGTDYYVMGVKAGDGVYYDDGSTEKLQNSSLKNIAELRKAYQK